MNHGARDQLIFLDDTDRRMFLSLLSVIHERFGVETQAYALMGNHYHLVLHCPQGNLSRAMQYLSSVYTQRFNRRHGFDGALFRGRFHSIPVGTDEYLIELTRYVHRNPKDVKFKGELAAYPWSSYAMYLGRRLKPEWLGQPLALAFVGQSAERYRTYVEAPRGADSEGPANPNPRTMRAVVLEIRPNHLKVHAGTSATSLDRVEAAVIAASGVTLDQLLTEEIDNPPREVALLLATECTTASAAQILDWCCASDPEALTESLDRARERLSQAPFADLLSRSRERLYESTTRDAAS